MSVELKVVLVGEDDQQQQAFNNPQPAANAAGPQLGPQPSAPTTNTASTVPPAPIAPPVVNAPVQPSPAPSSTSQPPVQPMPAAPSSSASSSQANQPPVPPLVAPPIQVNAATQSLQLIDTIEQLIDSIDQLVDVNTQSQRGHQSSSVPSAKRDTSWFDGIANRLDRKIDDIGLANTSVGNFVSSLAHQVADLSTRLTKFGSSVTGLGGGATQTATTTAASSAAGSTATRAAAGAATAGTGAATSAAGGAVGSAGVTALASAAGPLVAVALAAGATALSLKFFMDQVEKAAGELQDLSPQIAAVRAQHEVNLELARLDRARRVGSDVANLDHARHRINESMYELQTKIYELILKGSPVLEAVLDAINVVVRGIDTGVSSVNALAATLTPDPTDDAPAQKKLNDSINDLNKAITELFHGHAQQPPIDPILAEILKMPGGR